MIATKIALRDKLKAELQTKQTLNASLKASISTKSDMILALDERHQISTRELTNFKHEILGLKDQRDAALKYTEHLNAEVKIFKNVCASLSLIGESAEVSAEEPADGF